MSRILCVGDTHCGNLNAVSSAPINDTQEFLLNMWETMCAKVGHVDTVLCNGDMIDGPNKKEDGQDLISTDIIDQATDAKTLLQLIDADRYIFTNGSPYHTTNQSGDKMTCKLIGGEWGNEHAAINEDEIRVHLRHKVGYSSDKKSRATPLMKDILTAELTSPIYGDYQVLVRGHTHRYVFAGTYQNLAFTTPCWKGLDKFMGSNSADVPDCGYVVIDTDGPEYTWSSSIFHLPKEYVIDEF